MGFLSSFTLPSLSSLNALSDVQIEQPLASPRNTLPTGQVNLGPGITGNVVGSVPSSAIGTGPFTGTLNTPAQIPDASGGIMQQEANAVAQGATPMQAALSASPASASNTVTSLLSSRFVSGVIGVLCIGAGLFMFKGTRDVVVNVGKKAASVAAVA